MRFLHRLGADLRFGYVIELAVESNGVFGPERDHRFEEFVRARAPSLERRPGGFKLIARPACAYAHSHSPARKRVNSTDAARKLDGRVVRKHNDARAKLHAGCVRGDERKRFERVENYLICFGQM